MNNTATYKHFTGIALNQQQHHGKFAFFVGKIDKKTHLKRGKKTKFNMRNDQTLKRK